MSNEIEAIKERRAKITPPPWDTKYASYMPPEGSPQFHPLATGPLRNNADFIAHAPADIDYLLAKLTNSEQGRRNMEETVDNVRVALGLESTHWMIIADQVADVVRELAAAREEIDRLKQDLEAGGQEKK